MKYSWNLGFACLLIFWTSSTLAWENFPEFEGLSEWEQENAPKPTIMDAEYESDVRAYTKPTYMEESWLSHKRAFDFTSGSISSQQFLLNNRLKVYEPLTDFLEFRLTYFNEKNHERESQHTILELITWFHKKWGLSVYGEPYYHKRKNDMGLALLFAPSTQHEIRLFNSFVDLVRQERNDRKDRFVEPHYPNATGIVGRFWKKSGGSKVEFLQYALRYESHTKWYFPSQDLQYSYWKKFASFYWRHLLKEDLFLTTRLQFDQKLEKNEPTDPASTVSFESWLSERKLAAIELEMLGIFPKRSWYIVSGLNFAGRLWQTEAGRVHHENFLPHVAWILPPSPGDYVEWSFEYETTLFQAVGTKELLPKLTSSNDFSNRFNLGINWRFGEKASIKLVFTFDLDKLETEPWEGGDGQMHLVF